MRGRKILLLAGFPSLDFDSSASLALGESFEDIIKTIAIKPYYSDDAVVIYHADCRDILPLLPDKSIDLVLTDPPYGVDGGKGRNRIRAKAKYSVAGFDDTDDYVRDICVPIIKQCIEKAQRVVVTSGNKNIQYYPRFTDIGGFYIPNSIGLSPWGIQSFQVILYYGKDPYPQKFKSACLLTSETSEVNGHPCPKPTNAWSWLLARASLINDIILDPFLGSGTTVYCAKKLGRKCIGIEIEERYCEIAAKRCSQSVMKLGQDENGNICQKGDEV